MTTYFCLDCNHQFEGRQVRSELAKPRQCGSCWGYNVVSLNEYTMCKDKANELIETTPLGIIPMWDVIKGIFIVRGIQLSPRLTLILCERLYSDIMKERGYRQ